MVITADIGATKTVLAQAHNNDGTITLESVKRYEGRRYATFESVVEQYLRDTGPAGVSELCIGAAGVVADNRCVVTYRDWIVDGADLARRFGFKRVMIMNDLQAAGYGLDFLPESAFETINLGKPLNHETRAMISPGTGLGTTIIPNIDGRYYPIASEGGHAGFASFDGATRRLWEFARQTRPHVSWETFLSGSGFGLLYRFLAADGGLEIPPEVEKELDDDPGRAVTALALDKRDPLAVMAVGFFFDILASTAGDLTLMGMARGGVYIGGGIVPKISGLVNKDRFVTAFSDKGVHEALLREIPIKIVMDPLLPLYGAAGYAFISSHKTG
jgi:glucokinase